MRTTQQKMLMKTRKTSLANFKDPKTLNGPVDEELGRIVLDIVEPHVLPHFYHPLHQEGAKSSSPYTHQAW